MRHTGLNVAFFVFDLVALYAVFICIHSFDFEKVFFLKWLKTGDFCSLNKSSILRKMSFPTFVLSPGRSELHYVVALLTICRIVIDLFFGPDDCCCVKDD